MSVLFVIENPKNWPLDLPGVQVVRAREYLTEPRFSERRRTRVFNLCRRYGYQSLGYYVSLLAEARGHRPLPSVATMQDLRLSPLVRLVSGDLEPVIQKSLRGLRSSTFAVSIYFGGNMARRYDRLSRALFNYFPAPLLRAYFERVEGRWRLDGVQVISGSEIPEGHRPFLIAQAQRYFDRPHRGGRARTYRFELAILVDPDEEHAPSNPLALRKFARAARSLGMNPTFIDRDDLGRLAEFDALFIRETTAVNHHTYRFARKARAEGIEVIDDPQSILRCSNKVYLAELFARHGVAHPRTLILHRDNADEGKRLLGFPCILKRPDGSFSRGITRATDETSYDRAMKALFEESDLVIAQEFVQSEFDWRVGVLDGRALYACRYYMAPGDWRIIGGTGAAREYGEVRTYAVEDVPPAVVALAERCTAPVGRGFYGVDLKERDGRFLVMEINDNPNLDAGFEDAVLGPEIYRRILRVFVERLERRGRSEGRE